MGVKNITSYEASDIARQIAKKAFEHLLAEPYQKLNYAGGLAYDRLYEVMGTTPQKMLAAGFGGNSNTVRINVTNLDGQEQSVEYRKEDVVQALGYYPAKLCDDAMFDLITEAKLLTNPLEAKRAELEGELRSQLIGKSAATAKKAWPEAAEFIDAHFCITTGTPMTQPLEELLARFLPMLPAPQGA